MARAALLGRLIPLRWLVADLVESRPESATAVTLTFDAPGWRGHEPGQHVDVRLTAEDGYQAERSYSIAGGDGEQRIELTVERIDEGEVSPYLCDILELGEQVELRGPIGGHFVRERGPALLVGGGSGVAPLRGMLAEASATGDPTRLVYSVRSRPDVLYAGELLERDDVIVTYTREAPPGWEGPTGRVDPALIRRALDGLGEDPRALVCGPTPFVEAVAELLVDAGLPARHVKTERFGPTGM